MEMIYFSNLKTRQVCHVLIDPTLTEKEITTRIENVLNRNDRRQLPIVPFFLEKISL
jgi:hypothetical protein